LVLPYRYNRKRTPPTVHKKNLVFFKTKQIVQPEEVSVKDDFGFDDDFNAGASNDGGFGDFGEFNNAPVKQDFGFDEIVTIFFFMVVHNPVITL